MNKRRMVNQVERLTKSVLVAAVIAGVFLAPGSPRAEDSRNPVGKDGDAAVTETLQDRVKLHCRPLLGNWWKAKGGMQDRQVRAMAADCYIAHVRLAVMGVGSGLPVEEASASELPIRILAARARLDPGFLDPYRALMGRELESGAKGK